MMDQPQRRLIPRRAFPYHQALARIEAFASGGGFALHREAHLQIDRHHPEHRVREEQIPGRESEALMFMQVASAIEMARERGRREAGIV